MPFFRFIHIPLFLLLLPGSRFSQHLENHQRRKQLDADFRQFWQHVRPGSCQIQSGLYLCRNVRARLPDRQQRQQLAAGDFVQSRQMLYLR